MIPNDGFVNDFTIQELPTTTNKLNISAKNIRGFIKELPAMAQAIYLILNVERYKHEIYSRRYGIEVCDLIGKPSHLVTSELETRITEALLQDTRIKAVSDFLFKTEKKKVIATFTVTTIYGDINAEKAVDI